MNGANDIRDELRGMASPLADFPKTMPYAVPEGYFRSFTAGLGIGAGEEDLEYSKGWGKQLPYTLPENYFDTLSGHIAALAKADSLSSMTKAIPFAVPQGYFAQLPAATLRRAKKEHVKTRRTIAIPANIIRLAAAAVVVLGVGVGVLQFWSMPMVQAPEKMLSSISGNDLQEYVQHTYRMDVDRVISNNDINKIQVENKDIIQYLNETGWD